jgi:hypothetical protein
MSFNIFFNSKSKPKNNGHIYDICNIIDPFFFLNYIKFGFELVNQKMFEMKILKMTHHTSCHLPFESDCLSKC